MTLIWVEVKLIMEEPNAKPDEDEALDVLVDLSLGRHCGRHFAGTTPYFLFVLLGAKCLTNTNTTGMLLRKICRDQKEEALNHVSKGDIPFLHL